MIAGLALAALALASLPALLFVRNLSAYRPPPPLRAGRRPRVSVLIPARNEERVIEAAVLAALADEGVDQDIVVLDDHSEDRTAEIVRAIAARDARVRLESAPLLPEGWCGKQHACSVLASRASGPLLVFVDADVRLEPGALGRIAAFMDESGADLASGFPRQETETFVERLLLPLMTFVLLGYLPIDAMRRSRLAGFGAACGQLVAARKDAYERAGGHAAIRASMHDGVTLPRAFRRAGLRTDLFDATRIASCRMYRGARETWRGLSKNATEGIGAPAAILPWTFLLIGGHVLPFVLAGCGAAGLVPPRAALLAAAACVASWLPRLLSIRRFSQPIDGALLHPVGIAALLAIQYTALAGRLVGRPSHWKGRTISPR